MNAIQILARCVAPIVLVTVVLATSAVAQKDLIDDVPRPGEPQGVVGSPQQVLVDDVARAVENKQGVANTEQSTQPIKFPRWLGIDGEPMRNVNMHSQSDGLEATLTIDELVDHTAWRRFELIQNSDNSAMKVKITRFFNRDDVKEFATHFPEFSEYANAIPGKHGDIELGVSFTASINYEFKDFEDMKARASELHETIGFAGERTLGAHQRRVQILNQTKEAMRAKPLSDQVNPTKETDKDDD